MKEQCCFCNYISNERGVRTHIPLAHPEIVEIRKIVMHGRPKLETCKLCGMIHDDFQRPDHMEYRRSLGRPKAAILVGRFPENHNGKELRLGTLPVPDGMTRISGLKIWAENPGQVKIVVEGREYVFNVGPGYVRPVT